MNEPQKAAPKGTFLERHEFLLRRLHSLSGLVPVGAYMVVHLLTNASVLDSAASFQRNVYSIHSLGAVLPVVEWTFIFIPLLYHAIYGILIVRGAAPNSSTYKYTSNVRYTLQRATGMIAFVFIMWHVFHMHGWFHSDAWLHNVAEPLNGAMFRPYNAASTAARALQISMIVPILYAIGVLSCVFHLANGIWTFGITWGLWVTPASQRWANAACLVFGLGLAAVSMGALGGFAFGVKPEEAQQVEDKMYEHHFAVEIEQAKEIGVEDPGAHKRYSPKEHLKAGPVDETKDSGKRHPTSLPESENQATSASATEHEVKMVIVPSYVGLSGASNHGGPLSCAISPEEIEFNETRLRTAQSPTLSP